MPGRRSVPAGRVPKRETTLKAVSEVADPLDVTLSPAGATLHL